MTKDMISQSIFSQSQHSAAFAWTRMCIVTLIALGYVSTMPLGPGSKEALFMFGYDPSWMGVNVLFMLSGFMVMRSLQRHENGLKMLASRAARNLPTLVIYTLAILCVIFPIFGVKANDFSSLAGKLAKYAFDVVSCTDPGRLLPGLLDDAKYACVIQGALWTFRWGLIAYIAAASAWSIGLFKRPIYVLVTALTAMVGYMIALGTHVWDVAVVPSHALTVLRLAWPFLMGMSIYAFKDRLPRHWAIAAGLLTLTSFSYFIAPWTPLIEILATLFYSYTAYLMITSQAALPKFMRKAPDLSLGIYVFHWPTAQILLLLVPGATSMGLFAMTLPITLIISASIWWGLQRPINRKLPAISRASLSKPSKVTG